ncbi:hypothetical protein DSL92_08730 [Billgrantia gudaonensis]|uniref:Uncharacterized protein n=1 Tax=Billgrantia gudaonensis TaxID=376427 RepID=A0A3S0NGV3_9GAMM|nr:hypothetical protein DSL92_08730 [Halomonas gudaonensis]
MIDVEWEGPDNPRDYLTIVEAGAPEGSHLDYTRTQRGSPLSLTPRMRWATTRFATSSSSPAAPGQSADHPDFRRSQSLGPDEAPAGSVDRRGGKALTTRGITSPSSKPRPEAAISTTPAPSAVRRCRSPHRMLGNYEIRYVIQQSGCTSASQPITLTSVGHSSAPDEAPAGLVID